MQVLSPSGSLTGPDKGGAAPSQSECSCHGSATRSHAAATKETDPGEEQRRCCRLQPQHVPLPAGVSQHAAAAASVHSHRPIQTPRPNDRGPLGEAGLDRLQGPPKPLPVRAWTYCSHDARCHHFHCFVGYDPSHQCSFCWISHLQPDAAEVLSADPIDLQCVPMEAHFCPVPKLLVAAPMTLNPVSLSRNPTT